MMIVLQHSVNVLHGIQFGDGIMKRNEDRSRRQLSDYTPFISQFSIDQASNSMSIPCTIAFRKSIFTLWLRANTVACSPGISRVQ